MAVTQFIPEVWADEINEILRKELVFGNLLNNDYEGNIRQMGDLVHIHEIGDISISNYTPNSTALPTVQMLDAARVSLRIDRARQFWFKLDDVDNAQTNPKLMQAAIQRAAYNLKDDIDSFIAQRLSSQDFFQGINSTEIGSTVTALSMVSTLAMNALSWYQTIMDQNNVPSQGRWIVMPPRAIQNLAMARIIAETANSPAINEGLAPRGRAFGFDIYESNNIYSTLGTSSQFHIIAGHKMGASVAMQINNVESFRSMMIFGDEVRGLMLYGVKVVRPTAILKGVHTF